MTVFAQILRAQDTLNILATRDPNYQQKRLPFYRKAWEECAEMLVHLGDHWWRIKPVEESQVFLELVDVLHFVLSEYLNEYGHDDALIVRSGELIDRLAFSEELPNLMSRFDIQAKDDNGFRYKFVHGLETFVQASIFFNGSRTKERTGNENPHLDGMTAVLMMLVAATGRTPRDMIEVYISKFTLNVFRQNNGYREGSYVKLYDGEREDNSFLEETFQKFKGPYTAEGKNMLDELTFAQIVETLYRKMSRTYYVMVQEKEGVTVNDSIDKANADLHTLMLTLAPERTPVLDTIGSN